MSLEKIKADAISRVDELKAAISQSEVNHKAALEQATQFVKQSEANHNALVGAYQEATNMFKKLEEISVECSTTCIESPASS